MIESDATPVALLDVLAKDTHPDVRCAVAANASTSVGAIKVLAMDKETIVRRAIASNPATPVAMLKDLANNKDATVRHAVVGNKATPRAALAVLAKDDDDEVWRAVVGNESTPDAVRWPVTGTLAGGPIGGHQGARETCDSGSPARRVAEATNSGTETVVRSGLRLAIE